MSDTEERSVRDRLAEALWLNPRAPNKMAFADLPAYYRAQLDDDADDLLAALPTVGLKIGTAE
jgi:hypothetical protein